MPKTMACLVVTSAKVFNWLGHKPVMNWALAALDEVRGLDKIVCLAASRYADQAKKLLAREQIEVVSLPKAVAAATNVQVLDKWLIAGIAAEYDVVAVVNPASPFLPGVKIEACINLVREQKADISCTSREVVARLVDADSARVTAYAELPGCRVFAASRPGPHRFKPVNVTLRESLDITEPSNLQIATALVGKGK